MGGAKTARASLIALLDDHLLETLQLPAPTRAMSARVRLTARAYLHSTPVRVMRRDRSIADRFGRRHKDPRDLQSVGYEPRQHDRRDRSKTTN